MQKAALELLNDSRGADAVRPEYWTGLCPEMTIGGKPASDTSQKPHVDSEAFGRDGYFCQPEVLPAAQTTLLAATVERLLDHGWPPIFAVVFDEFWDLAWTSAVRGTVASLLGRGPLLQPNVAVHYVNPMGHPAGLPTSTAGRFSTIDSRPGSR